jgi:hypothetical protein
MEILDINLTKESSLLLHAIHSPSTGRFSRQPYTSLYSLKNPYKKICETRKLESIRKMHFVERKNEGRKPDKNSRRLEFLPRNLDIKCRSRSPSQDKQADAADK